MIISLNNIGGGGGSAPAEDFPIDRSWLYKNSETSTYDQYWSLSPYEIYNRSSGEVLSSTLRTFQPKYASINFTCAFNANGSGSGLYWTDIEIRKASDSSLIKRYRYAKSTVSDRDVTIQQWNKDQTGTLTLSDVNVPFYVQISVHKGSDVFNYFVTLLRSMSFTTE